MGEDIPEISNQGHVPVAIQTAVDFLPVNEDLVGLKKGTQSDDEVLVYPVSYRKKVLDIPLREWSAETYVDIEAPTRVVRGRRNASCPDNLLGYAGEEPGNLRMSSTGCLSR